MSINQIGAAVNRRAERSKKAKKIRRHALVELNPATCFTVESGGGLEFPLVNYDQDERGVVRTFRPTTAGERAAWRSSEASQGMTSAGETKLPPTCTAVEMRRGEAYRVLRARCRVEMSYRVQTGLVEVESADGQRTFVRRELVRVIA